MSGLGVSIKGPKVEEEVKNTATATITPQTAQPEEDYIFNERDINYYWQEYAGRMPKEQVAIAKGAANGYYHKYGNYYGKSYYGKGYGYYGKHGYYGYGTEQK